MIIKKDKNKVRKNRHNRMRYKFVGTAAKPRLNVFRSLSHIYAQIIDDTANNGNGQTLVSASSLEKSILAQSADKKKTDIAKLVGKAVAEKAKEKNIKTVVFDRGGYIYTGRIAAVAEGAREAGLDF